MEKFMTNWCVGSIINRRLRIDLKDETNQLYKEADELLSDIAASVKTANTESGTKHPKPTIKNLTS